MAAGISDIYLLSRDENESRMWVDIANNSKQTNKKEDSNDNTGSGPEPLTTWFIQLLNAASQIMPELQMLQRQPGMSLLLTRKCYFLW
jgi:hypothetical protein